MIPVSNKIFRKLKDLYEQEEAMMAGQWPDGDYSEQFKEICTLNNLDWIQAWCTLQMGDSNFYGVDNR
tara:strand:+ start:1730 stop:1933 length:204 start_codon:yes stop_codon:yes gene_type:complete